MSNLFHIVELVHRDDHAAARDQKPGDVSELRIVTVKLVADSGDNARRIACERYPDYVVLRQSTRPTDSEPDEPT